MHDDLLQYPEYTRITPRFNLVRSYGIVSFGSCDYKTLCITSFLSQVLSPDPYRINRDDIIFCYVRIFRGYFFNKGFRMLDSYFFDEISLISIYSN
ncbi:hypothetical protein RclHR1_00940010 [Rhizophagus clarus]|uniref:Uncharacterized protein n=1 Tax=Rhizophagus clarus TaxID=94130 RepID=A0A2Z6SQM3_9GLOM|nr:hypothetical protein RclHR1_00940010 [Rhizophagus clarus]